MRYICRVKAFTKVDAQWLLMCLVAFVFSCFLISCNPLPAKVYVDGEEQTPDSLGAAIIHDSPFGYFCPRIDKDTDVNANLKALRQLRDDGIISDAEYRRRARDLYDNKLR